MARKTSFKNVQRGLQKMTKAIQSGRIDALAINGAERMLQIVKQQCPVDTGRLRDSLKITAEDKTSRPAPGRKGALSVQNNYCFITTDVHYAWFLEFGTSKMAPHPFMRPAFDVSARQVADGITAGVEGLMVQLFLGSL